MIHYKVRLQNNIPVSAAFKYNPVTDRTGNPSDKGLYKRRTVNGRKIYTLTDDTTFVNDTTYYARETAETTVEENMVLYESGKNEGVEKSVFTQQISNRMFDGGYEFTLLPDHPAYDKVQLGSSTIYIDDGDHEVFRGRPVRSKTDKYGRKTFTCENDLKFLVDVPDIFSHQTETKTVYKYGGFVEGAESPNYPIWFSHRSDTPDPVWNIEALLEQYPNINPAALGWYEPTEAQYLENGRSNQKLKLTTDTQVERIGPGDWGSTTYYNPYGGLAPYKQYYRMRHSYVEPKHRLDLIGLDAALYEYYCHNFHIDEVGKEFDVTIGVKARNQQWAADEGTTRYKCTLKRTRLVHYYTYGYKPIVPDAETLEPSVKVNTSDILYLGDVSIFYSPTEYSPADATDERTDERFDITGDYVVDDNGAPTGSVTVTARYDNTDFEEPVTVNWEKHQLDVSFYPSSNRPTIPYTITNDNDYTVYIEVSHTPAINPQTDETTYKTEKFVYVEAGKSVTFDITATDTPPVFVRVCAVVDWCIIHLFPQRAGSPNLVTLGEQTFVVRRCKDRDLGYTVIGSPEGNPKNQNYYEKIKDSTTNYPLFQFVKSNDTSVTSGKTYYEFDADLEVQQYHSGGLDFLLVVKRTDTTSIRAMYSQIFCEYTSDESALTGYNKFVPKERRIFAGNVEVDDKTPLSDINSIYSRVQKWLQLTNGYAKTRKVEDTYRRVEHPGSNPKNEGYYEKIGVDYVLTEDTEPIENKKYYYKQLGGYYVLDLLAESGDMDDSMVLQLDGNVIGYDQNHEITSMVTAIFPIGTVSNEFAYIPQSEIDDEEESDEERPRKRYNLKGMLDEQNAADCIYEYGTVNKEFQIGTGDTYIKYEPVEALDTFPVDLERNLVYSAEAVKRYGWNIAYETFEINNADIRWRLNSLYSLAVRELRSRLTAQHTYNTDSVDPRLLGAENAPVLGNYYLCALSVFDAQEYLPLTKIVNDMLKPGNSKMTIGDNVYDLSDYVAKKQNQEE